MAEAHVLRLIASNARLVLAVLPPAKPDAASGQPKLRALRFNVALRGRIADLAALAPWELDLAWPLASESVRQELVRRHLAAVVLAAAREEGLDFEEVEQ